jgi:hypothetical protein
MLKEVGQKKYDKKHKNKIIMTLSIYNRPRQKQIITNAQYHKFVVCQEKNGQVGNF